METQTKDRTWLVALAAALWGTDALLRKPLADKLPAAENIAEGQKDVGAAVTAWINSPKHLHNMLGKYEGLGVAIARDASSDGKPYWSMVLSTT